MDTLAVFLRTIKDCKVPTPAEQRELLKRAILRKDISARNELVRRNLPLAINYARKYQGRGLDLEDLVQHAAIGIMRAIDRFDLARTNGGGDPIKFGTYCVYWMLQELRRATTSGSGRSLIHLPQYLWGNPGRQCDNTKKLFEQMGKSGFLSSLNYEFDMAGHSNDVETKASYADPVKNLLAKEEILILRERLNRIPPKWRDILIMRLKGMTLMQIGKSIGLTRERVRQLQYKALVALAQQYGLEAPVVTKGKHIFGGHAR